MPDATSYTFKAADFSAADTQRAVEKWSRRFAEMGAKGSTADLGRHFGGHLYEREARYLIEQEWARSAEDILERRSKHGLHLSAEQRADLAAWLEGEGRSWAESA